MEKGMAGEREDGEQVEPVDGGGIQSGAMSAAAVGGLTGAGSGAAAPGGSVPPPDAMPEHGTPRDPMQDAMAQAVAGMSAEDREKLDEAIDAGSTPGPLDFQSKEPPFADPRIRRMGRPDDRPSTPAPSGPLPGIEATKPPAGAATAAGPAPSAGPAAPTTAPAAAAPTQPTAAPEVPADATPGQPPNIEWAGSPYVPAGTGAMQVGPPPAVVPERKATGIRKYVYIKDIGRVRWDRLDPDEQDQYLRDHPEANEGRGPKQAWEAPDEPAEDDRQKGTSGVDEVVL